MKATGLIIISICLVFCSPAKAKPFDAGERLLKNLEEFKAAPVRQRAQTEAMLKVGQECVNDFDELAAKVPAIQKEVESISAEGVGMLQKVQNEIKMDQDRLQKIVQTKNCATKYDPLETETYEASQALQKIESKMEALQNRIYKVRNEFTDTFSPVHGAANGRVKMKPASCHSDYRAAYDKAFANPDSEKKVREANGLYAIRDAIWSSKGLAHDLSGEIYHYHTLFADLNCTCNRGNTGCETSEEREERITSPQSGSGN